MTTVSGRTFCLLACALVWSSCSVLSQSVSPASASERDRADALKAVRSFDGGPETCCAMLLGQLGVANFSWYAGSTLGPYGIVVNSAGDKNLLPRWKAVIPEGGLGLVIAPGWLAAGFSGREGDRAVSVSSGEVWILDPNGARPPVKVGASAPSENWDAMGLILVVGDHRVVMMASRPWEFRAPYGERLQMREGGLAVLAERLPEQSGGPVLHASGGSSAVWTDLPLDDKQRQWVTKWNSSSAEFVDSGTPTGKCSQEMADAVIAASGIRLHRGSRLLLGDVDIMDRAGNETPVSVVTLNHGGVPRGFVVKQTVSLCVVIDIATGDVDIVIR